MAEKPVATKTAATKPAAKSAAPATAKKAASAEKPAAVSKPDDLTRIKGIGPKMAEALQAEGIETFGAIAKWTLQDVARMDAKLGGLPGRITRDDWVGQAKKLAG